MWFVFLLIQVDVASFESWNRNLHGHHGNEDASWFPSLRKKHPIVAPAIDILEKDHETLVSMEKRIEKGDMSSLTEFVALLNDHLNREEMITVPFLLDGTGGW